MANVPEQLPADPVPEAVATGHDDAGEITEVGDDERVYRAVADNPNCFSMSGGVLRLSHSAFNDHPDSKPSVDRVSMLQGDPEASRRTPTDGVVVLAVQRIREIAPVQKDHKGREVQRHSVDVVHDPKPFNRAHALVVANPELGSSVFKKLREALCLLADPGGWKVEPASLQKDA